jgi:hypothetical protein
LTCSTYLHNLQKIELHQVIWHTQKISIFLTSLIRQENHHFLPWGTRQLKFTLWYPIFCEHWLPHNSRVQLAFNQTYLTNGMQLHIHTKKLHIMKICFSQTLITSRDHGNFFVMNNSKLLIQWSHSRFKYVFYSITDICGLSWHVVSDKY